MVVLKGLRRSAEGRFPRVIERSSIDGYEGSHRGGFRRIRSAVHVDVCCGTSALNYRLQTHREGSDRCSNNSRGRKPWEYCNKAGIFRGYGNLISGLQAWWIRGSVNRNLVSDDRDSNTACEHCRSDWTGAEYVRVKPHARASALVLVVDGPAVDRSIPRWLRLRGIARRVVTG
jgi:hypothetical protein